MIEIKKILDFSDYSQFALKYAMALAKAFKAKLYVMHVCEHWVTDVGPKVYHFSIPKFLTDVEKNEKQTLSQIVQKIQSKRIAAEGVFVTRKTYVAIVEKAKELDVDVITLATHGRKGFNHLVFGSTAEKL